MRFKSTIEDINLQQTRNNGLSSHGQSLSIHETQTIRVRSCGKRMKSINRRLDKNQIHHHCSTGWLQSSDLPVILTEQPHCVTIKNLEND